MFVICSLFLFSLYNLSSLLQVLMWNASTSSWDSESHRPFLLIDSFGEFRQEEFWSHVKERTLIEQSGGAEVDRPKSKLKKSRSSGISRCSIQSSDVLLGSRSGVMKSHPANLRLAKIIQAKRDEYERDSKFEKTCLSMGIVDMFKDSGGCFLKHHGKRLDEWIKVSDLKAQKSVIFRFQGKPPN